MGLLFFSQKPNKTFCLVSVKKHSMGKMGLGLLCMGCCVWVCCGLPGYVIEKKGRGSISNGEERWLSREGMGNLVNDDLFVGETKGAFSLSDSLSLLCLCMGLLCLVFGKNTRVLVCCGWMGCFVLFGFWKKYRVWIANKINHEKNAANYITDLYHYYNYRLKIKMMKT